MSDDEPRLLSAPSVLAAGWDEIAFARAHVPAFDGLPAVPQERGYEQFVRTVPVTRKGDYRRGFPTRVVSSGAEILSPDVLMSHSSGTGGERLTSVSYLYDLSARQSTTMQANPVFGALLGAISGQRVCRFAAPNCSDVECSNPLSTIEDRTLRDGTLVLPVAHDLYTTPDRMLDQALHELIEYRPHWLYCEAAHLSFLLVKARAAGITRIPGVRAVVLTYTRATHAAKRLIREFFGPRVPVAEVISMSELGWLAMECPRGRVHLNSQSFVAELLIHGEGTPAGELALTTIGDKLSPHLRYATGDIYSLYESACECGIHVPSVRLEGRPSEALLDGDGNSVWPRQVDDLVGAPDNLLSYRVHQDERGDVEFGYIPLDPDRPTPFSEPLARALSERLPGRSVTVRATKYLPCQRSGKFVACTSTLARDAS